MSALYTVNEGKLQKSLNINTVNVIHKWEPTPLSIVSLLSLHFMNRTTFQLVLQFTELTWGKKQRIVTFKASNFLQDFDILSAKFHTLL